MVRHGEVIAIKSEYIDSYIEHHRTVWPEVAAKIYECNIRNYSIYMDDGFLFAYYEYVGPDFASDMARMAADPKTQDMAVGGETSSKPSGVEKRSRTGGLPWTKFSIRTEGNTLQQDKSCRA